VKAHGLRGEVVVELVTDVVARLAPGSRLEAGDDTLVVEAARPHQGRFIVAFEGVVSREGADALRGCSLRAEPLDDPEALWVHELIGAAVSLVDGTPCGVVTAVQANPADDLLVLDSGHLVPVRFVVGWADDGLRERVIIDPPEGLFDV
jgi:16S rRNA processing protein RimM